MSIKLKFLPLALVLFVVTTEAFSLTDEQYHEMPSLFDLDDYNACLAKPRGVFCLGTFSLTPYTNKELYSMMKEFSRDRYNFNHTRLHRGFCLTSRCVYNNSASHEQIFEQCVDQWVRKNYGLQAKLEQLKYCKFSSQRSGTIDAVDLGFAGVVLALLLFNAIGTTYDVFRDAEKKPIKFIKAWSLIANWRKLVKTHADGDPRLSALNPVQGMKALTLVMVMLAHSIISHYMTYLHNPDFLEKATVHPLAVYLHNGAVIVQTFIMISSFLLAYNLLFHVENNPEIAMNLWMLPKCIFHRITRILPAYMFVVGLVATWWRHLGDGPLWTPIIEDQARICRDKWWTQALFVNNFINPDDKCLIQTWFLAVDMQLYILAAFLTLALGRQTKLAMSVLAVIFPLSMVLNFLIAYRWDLKPILYKMDPELLSTQYRGSKSFNWMYAAPWNSLPASILGLFLAYLYYHLETLDYKLAEKLYMRILYRVSLPLMFVWVLCGYFVRQYTSPLFTAVYAALDRPGGVVFAGVVMLGFFSKVDSIIWRLMSWRGWQIAGRMSLSVLMLHWSYNLTQIAVRITPTWTSVFEIIGDGLVTVLMTYISALPLTLMVEYPAQKFFQSFFS